MQISIYNSPLGSFYLRFHASKLVHASFDEGQGYRWQNKHFPKLETHVAPLPKPYKENLDNYFQGHTITWNWPLDLIGTDFQIRVWREIQKVPQGKFTTYKKIAQSLDTKAYQAVGRAVGANPISIIIPCHRVLGTNWLGGYGGGLNRKRLLLELENVTLAPNFFA